MTMTAICEQSVDDRLWRALTIAPLGSLSKREMEIAIIQAAIDAGKVESSPAAVAMAFRITLRGAQAYLTDLALRRPALADAEALMRLRRLLAQIEVSASATYLSFAVHDAALRIWLERKMVTLQLHGGDSLRLETVRLTPNGLARLLAATDGARTPYGALRALPAEMHGHPWFKEAKKTWRKDMSWPAALDALANGTTVA
ncbi:MAG TPA: hypothetical protein PKA16_05990 [Ottowia sp.]|uniref:hypothetical protein n=1 Tax=Ottowia sp. TaxID=1898956 RepID=UPI002C120CC1|nr:hypothetical protein [Ottowia sp.]HMN20927.1 hypothetical protein [Ottowia sp.]